MSRIGKLPITIPAGVTITVSDDNTVTVKGPKGQLSEKISPRIKVSMDAGILKVERPTDEKEDRSLHGLSRTLINNMVVGTTKGFEKKLEINGTGYRAQKNGNKLVLNVGYSHPVEFEEGDGQLGCRRFRRILHLFGDFLGEAGHDLLRHQRFGGVESHDAWILLVFDGFDQTVHQSSLSMRLKASFEPMMVASGRPVTCHPPNGVLRAEE